MPSLTPRRLTGNALKLSARGDRLPLLGAGLRAAGRPLLHLEILRQARLGEASPGLVPPTAQAGSADGRADEAT